MSIQLPEYSSLVENSVFSRDIFKDLGDEKNIMLKQILMLRRYEEATEDDVVRYLQTKVEELAGASALILPKGVDIANRSPLEKEIIKLNQRILRDIRNGGEDCLDFIRKNTKARKLKDGEVPFRYLHIRHGLVPYELEGENLDMKSIHFYDNLLSYLSKQSNGVLGEIFKISLLTDNWTLPDRSDLEVLLRHVTNSSRTFEINRYRYNIEEVRSILDAVYSGLSNKEDILRLKDVSDKVLEENAIPPIIALHGLAGIHQIIKAQKNDRDSSIN